jgi:omega-3 fatty acid desaturase (delta-15 desaturase)
MPPSFTSTTTATVTSTVAIPSKTPVHTVPTSTNTSNVPSTLVVPFTLTQLKDAIPAHCFQLDHWHATWYLIRDYFLVAACYAFYPYISTSLLPLWVYWPLKIVWWNVVGFLGWCLFVVGHDCGHRTYSPSLFSL